MKELPLSEGFTLVLEQNKKDLRIVTDYAKTVPYRVDTLLKFYVIDCKLNFDLFDKCIKYSRANELPLEVPPTKFQPEIDTLCDYECPCGNRLRFDKYGVAAIKSHAPYKCANCGETILFEGVSLSGKPLVSPPTNF